MEEAKFSFNVKFLYQGYDCCFTVREDQPGKAAELVDKAIQVINYLGTKGAAPMRQFAAKPTPSAVEKPAAANPAAKSTDIPVCKHCNSSENVEWVEWEKEGQPHRAPKCQACQKWVR